MSREPILIIEDNPINVKLFRVLLEKAGFQVRTAGDAEEAMTVLASFSPNLILMDVQLPGMDGLELTRRLKADARYRHIAIVALTAYAMRGDQERATDSGCEGHIAKPIDTRTFVETVRQHLVNRPQPEAQLPVERKLILIADDDPAQRRLFEIHLTQLGFEVVCAKDGAEAIDKMHERPPDLVASDVLMPRLDGFRLAQFIRQEPALSSIPVVLMTSGVIRADDQEMARGMGANSLVARTDGFEQIITAIRTALVDGPVTSMRPEEEVVEELRGRFLADAQHDLQNLLDTLQSNFDLGRTKKMAHRWAGTGGTLGLPQVSQMAFEIERMLDEDDPDGQAVASKLSHLNDILATAARSDNLASISDAVASSLSGKRFAAVGFDDVEAMRLSETLEQAHAMLRIRYAIPDSSEASLYDGVIVSAGNEADPTLRNFISKIDTPLVAVGLSGPTVERALNLHTGEHDFLIRPWNPSELVLRCYTVLSRSAGRDRRAGTKTAKSRPNILIGDDDPATVALLRTTLERHDVDCESVSEGSELLKAAADLQPDLVVLDVNIPQSGGFEVLSALKQNAATKKIPVVLLAARQLETDVLRGFSLGAEDYVTKPFSPVELVARIKRSLRSTA